jgi:lysophospholipase L1-like esterase
MAMKRLMLFATMLLFLTPAIRATAQTVVVAEGDSITCCSPAATYMWPHYLQNLSWYTGLATPKLFNDSKSGSTMNEVAARYAAKVKPYCKSRSYANKYLLLYDGINDMNIYQHPLRTAPAVYAQMTAYWDQARADGCKVVAFTVSTAIWSSSQQNLLNTLIRGGGSHYDYLVDLAATSLNYPNATYYTVDNVHPNDLGQELIAAAVNAALTASPSR